MTIKMKHSGTALSEAFIKPCPFCNSTELLISNKEQYEELCAEHGSSLVSIECKGCDTEMRLYSVPENNYWLGIGLLIGKWNRRRGDNE